ncbi:MAG: TRAP transporter substrate-binding protein [Eubacteriales bacterium]|jgi:TRAP-type C4-dicarboxylate transport system substrate-binding protein
MMKKILAAIMALSMVAALAACGGDTQTSTSGSDTSTSTSTSTSGGGAKTEFSLSHTSSAGSPWEKASLAFADYVNSNSETISVKTFPNGTLCQSNWSVMFEMIQSGSINMGIESVTSLSSIAPSIGTMQLPFLFDNKEHMVEFLNSDSPIMDKWYGEFNDVGMQVITSTPREFRQVANNVKIIKTPEDIKGMKLRCPDNPYFVAVFEALGAKPVPLPSGEIYSAIQLGTVNGEDNSLPVQYDFKTPEVAKYFTIWDYMADASLLVMNKSNYDGLSDDDKKVVEEAGQVWFDTNIAEDEAYTKMAREDMETNMGVEIYEMTAEEKEPFKEMTAGLYDDKKAEVGEEDYNAFMAEVDALRK